MTDDIETAENIEIPDPGTGPVDPPDDEDPEAEPVNDTVEEPG